MKFRHFLCLFVFAVVMFITPVYAQNLGSAWTATFYLDTNLTGDPVATDVQYPSGICANWSTGVPFSGGNMPCQPGSPLKGVPANEFSARFTSTQSFQETGIYRFTIVVDDAIRLSIDGNVVVDRFFETDTQNTYQADVNLSAGEHTLVVDYAEFTGNALIQVQWGLVNTTAKRLMVDNGGFESRDGTGKPDTHPWIIKQASGNKVKCSKDENGDGIPDKIFGNSGLCAFVFNGAEGKLKQKMVIDINLMIGDTFVLYFAAKTEDGAVGEAKLILQHTDNTETKIPITIGSTGGSYADFNHSETLTRTDIYRAEISFKMTTDIGKLYVDDVRLGLTRSNNQPDIIGVPAAILENSN